MNPYKMFKTDEKIETDGLKLDYGDFKITIARAGGANAKYKRLIREHIKKYGRRIDAGTLRDEEATLIMAGIFADGVILGWENVSDENGKFMDFTRENCVKLLTDLPDLFADIREQAALAANFRAGEIERDSKK